MARRSTGTIEAMLSAAAGSQIGALVFGVLGLLLASPVPHAILEAISPGALSRNIYTVSMGNGLLGAGYMMLPWVRVFGFLLVVVAASTMLVGGRRPGYRTHLRARAVNNMVAGIFGMVGIALAFIDPPHFLPGQREQSEAMAAALGRPISKKPVAPHTSEGTPAPPIGSVFPANGTVQWGDEQPIGGNLARLDLWDATGSPQHKVVNIRSGYVAVMPGVRTPAYATVYVRAGQKVSIRLPADRPYRVTAMSGDHWQDAATLFGSSATTVDFGMMTLNPAVPQAVVMGAPDQTATVVSANRF